MNWDNDWPAPLPTREGEAIGTSNERRMLGKVGADSIRTVVQTNPDGSETVLRTRGGFPEFQTSSNAAAAPVLHRSFLSMAKNHPFSTYDTSSQTPISSSTADSKALSTPYTTDGIFGIWSQRRPGLPLQAAQYARIDATDAAQPKVKAEYDLDQYDYFPAAIEAKNVVRFGNPWHGHINGTQITLEDGSTKTIPDHTTGAWCWLTKFSGVAAPTNSTADAAAHRAWKNDAIWYGYAKRYSPDTEQAIGANSWVYRCADGTVWQLVASASIIASETVALDTSNSRWYGNRRKKFRYAFLARAADVDQTIGTVDSDWIYYYQGAGGTDPTANFVHYVNHSPDGADFCCHTAVTYPDGYYTGDDPYRAFRGLDKNYWVFRAAVSGGSATVIPSVSVTTTCTPVHAIVTGSATYADYLSWPGETYPYIALGNYDTDGNFCPAVFQPSYATTHWTVDFKYGATTFSESSGPTVATIYVATNQTVVVQYLDANLNNFFDPGDLTRVCSPTTHVDVVGGIPGGAEYAYDLRHGTLNAYTYTTVYSGIFFREYRRTAFC